MGKAATAWQGVAGGLVGPGWWCYLGGLPGGSRWQMLSLTGNGETRLILCEHGPEGSPALFDAPRDVVVAMTAREVVPALARAEAARRSGAWVAGYLAYEAGFALEPKLSPLMPRHRAGPLVALGIYDAPRDAASTLAQAAAGADLARLSPPRPLVSRAAYGRAFDRVAAYIAAGDCYQINLTFPMASRLLAGSPLDLYGALRARQAVGYGMYCDLGVGPVVISRSPELFFRVKGGTISARPMKGTAPRDPDPVVDAAIAAELAASDKGRAENLMIVDLLRNDISRISRVGSVKVPELFAVEPFATVHQMSSTITGQLLAGADLPGLMTALFPCGSVTGAPKIRAMQIIRAVERAPRGVYCGAMGWMGPDGDAAWNVAIRTLSLFPDGRVTLNVGGGVVYDSTADGEWEEALWKARYATGLLATPPASV